jgi:hypothetical protein
VSDLLAPRPDYDDDNSRTRAIWGLVALAIIAVLIVVVLLLIGGGDNHHGAQTPTDLSQLPTTVPTSSAQPSGPATSGGAASSPAGSSTATKITSPVPTSTANPCPTPGACPVPGDAGQLVAAINAFRTSHGQPPVAGTVSPQAQQCALSQGDGASCAPSWAWEPAPTQDGAKVVELIAGRGGEWLLDPTMTSFSIGWAYAPGTGYEVAVLKTHS